MVIVMNDKKRDIKDLTVKEKERLEKFNENRDRLLKQGYDEKDLTVSIINANVIGTLVIVPFISLFLVLFFVNGGSKISFDNFTFGELLLFLILIVLSIVIHELIHGITYSIFCENHFKDVEYGFIVKDLTPYCTCRAPLKKYQYILAISMPGIILGIIPSTIAVFTGSVFLIMYGLFMLLGACGDFLIILLIFKNKSKKKDVLYHDHPTECGVVMFER